MRLRLAPAGRWGLLGVLLLITALGIATRVWRGREEGGGADLRDGRHDRGANAIWLQHGWFGDDAWFERNGKRESIPDFRSAERIAALAARLREHHIRDLFPHLCPTAPDGALPPADPAQVERFLDAADGLRVIPWIGGAVNRQAFPADPAWRDRLAGSAAELLRAHPRLAGVHLNLEPCPNGNPEYLSTLDALRAALPTGKLLSVAAYPPISSRHPFPEVHWDREYTAAVASRVDQMAFMMYDTAQREPRHYRALVAAWTEEEIAWCAPTPVLLGLPTYADAGVSYHDPAAENLENGLLGAHAGLLEFRRLPEHYLGVALYCEWETDEAEWQLFRERFLAHR